MNDLRHEIDRRMALRDIRRVCEHLRVYGLECCSDTVLLLIDDVDKRVGYNMLWCLSHLSPQEFTCNALGRGDLIDRLLTEVHVGKRRLMLTMIDRMPVTVENVRSDFLDYCLERINSTEPYAIRALCLKQAFAQSRFYPELLAEFRIVVEMMAFSELSPGLESARRNVLKSIEKLL